jgi:hypothetical protein
MEELKFVKKKKSLKVKECKSQRVQGFEIENWQLKIVKGFLLRVRFLRFRGPLSSLH